jgi:hypothetical protein
MYLLIDYLIILEFYIIMNVAVGGTNGYFATSDAWSNKSPKAALDFWDAREKWQHTWNGEDAALKVDKVTVWEIC